MSQKVKMVIPSYVDRFKCIGGSCEDSCCIGWDIDIDKLTFRKYFRTKNQDMKKEFSKHVYLNEACDSEDVDYGRVRIKESKWCPFLNEKKLCDIYTNLGEDYLSNVCYSYPRVYNVLNEVFEMSLFMSCPEAVRQLMSQSEPISFKEKEVKLDKHIIHSYMNTSDTQWKQTPVAKLKSLRNNGITLMQDRSLSIESRLLNIGHMLMKEDKGAGINHGEELKTNNNSVFQMKFLKDVIDSLHVFTDIDSATFVNITKQVFEGYHIKDDNSLLNQAKLYEEGKEKVFKLFMNEYSYMLEHYLVNFMYQGNFPFTENENSFDGYIMLVIRYTLLRFYLIGLGLAKKEIVKEDVLELIQVYTKTIEHHKTFVIDLLEEVKIKDFDHIDFIHNILV